MALHLQLLRHIIERSAEDGQLTDDTAWPDTSGQIAGAKPLGGGDQGAHRAGQAIGHAEPDKNRQQQQEHRGQRENHREGDLNIQPIDFQGGVSRDRPFGFADMGEDIGVDISTNQKIGAGEPV